MNEGMNIGFLKNRIDILLAKFDESQVINYIVIDRKFRFLDIEIETKVKIQLFKYHKYHILRFECFFYLFACSVYSRDGFKFLIKRINFHNYQSR